jgi:hypothetical protein
MRGKKGIKREFVLVKLLPDDVKKMDKLKLVESEPRWSVVQRAIALLQKFMKQTEGKDDYETISKK